MSKLRADEYEAYELGGFLYWYMTELSRPPMPEKYQVILKDLITVGVQRWVDQAPYELWSLDSDSLARRTESVAIMRRMEDFSEPDLDTWRER